MLSDNIKNLRQEKGLSQEDLANKLNVVRQTISKWEKGLSLPDSDMLINIAKALGTTASALLDENSPEQNTNQIKKESAKPTKTKKKSSKAESTILLILGLPIWFPIYVLVWVIIILVWAIFMSFVAVAIGKLASGCYLIFTDYALSGVFLLGISFVFAGLSIFSFFGCKAATIGIIKFTKKLFLHIKSFFKNAKKEEVQ